jgi:hypothetical protein
MLAILQQFLAAALTLALGVLCLRVWYLTRTGTPAALPRAWGITGGYFAVIGAYSLVQAVVMAAAYRAGPGTAAYALAIEWGPPANMARAAAALVFPGLLMLSVSGSPLFREVGDPVRFSAAAVAAIAIGGTFGARWLHDGTIHQHLSVLAVLGTLLAVSLMGVLLVALIRDAMDRILWIALAVYTLKEVINVSLLSILAWWSMAAHPAAFRIFYWLSRAVMSAMCLLALRRLAHARAGTHVRALFEPVRPVRPPALG